MTLFSCSWTLEHVSQGGEVSILGNIQNSTGCSLGLLAVAHPAWLGKHRRSLPFSLILWKINTQYSSSVFLSDTACYSVNFSWCLESFRTAFIVSLEPAVPFPLLYTFPYSLSAESTPRLLCKIWQGQCHTFVSGIRKALSVFLECCVSKWHGLQQTISTDLGLWKAVVNARGQPHWAFLSCLPPF